MGENLTSTAPTHAATEPTPWWADAAAAAIGRREREEPVTPRSGGPAGNARLTAWLGLTLLVLLLAELVTLLDVRGLLAWHAAIGTGIGVLVVAKTGSTGWRMVRYYRGNPSYRVAGPPPTFFRLLGPLVVASAVAVVGTGLALVILAPSSAHQALLTFLGQRVDAVTLHQAAFIVFAVAVGLHALGRLVPALERVVDRTHAVPGGGLRVGVMVLAAVAAVVAVLLVVPLTSGWA